MDNDQNIVIVGASLAGAMAAEQLRESNFTGRVVLIGSETELPYERPPLSKDYLRGEADKPYVHDTAFYEEKGIELLLGTEVTDIDVEDAVLTVAGTAEIEFSQLLLTTGAEPRRLDLPGGNLDGIHYLRTIGDCDRIASELTPGRRVVVVGAGWIGSEVAASARQKECEVTLIAPEQVPLERVLGTEMGGVYKEIHLEHGVRFFGGTGVREFRGGGAVEAVVTDADESVECDLVVVGAGVLPRTGLAERAGLDCEDGILVGPDLQSSIPGIFAAGDVANLLHPFYRRRVRVEHWANARRQGRAAARSMLGEQVSFDEIPYFFSDQYDVGMEYVGEPSEGDELLVRGDPAQREFIVFWMNDGRIEAGMNVNVWEVSDTIRDLIVGRVEVDPAKLADPEVELASLL